jgi:peptidoglycan hydrolase FlgJ
MIKYIIAALLIAGVITYFVLHKNLDTMPDKNDTSNQATGFKLDKSNFTQIMKPAALIIQKETGIPYLFVLAQIALETGYGKSSLVSEAFNFGGIKAIGEQPYVKKWTYEYTTDKNKYPDRDKSKDVYNEEKKKWKVYTPQKFRKFESLKDGLLGYVKILQLPRYKKAFEHKDDAKKFAQEIFNGGYATDVNYVPKIHKMIDTFKTA